MRIFEQHRHVFVAAIPRFVMVLVDSALSGGAEGVTLPQNRPTKPVAFAPRQTANLLSVPVQNFPAPQGLKSFDELFSL